MRPLKILFVTHCIVMGGANRAMFELIGHLRAMGHTVTVFAPVEPVLEVNIVTELKHLGVPVYQYPFPWIRKDSTARILYMQAIQYPHRYVMLNDARGMGFDLVHSNGSVISVGAWLARKLGVPHVWHLREFGDLDFGLKFPFGRLGEKVVYGGKSHFIAISQAVANRYQRSISNDKIHLIYDGLSMPATDPVSTHDGDVTNFVITGMVSLRKRQIDAIKALDIVVNGHGVRNVHLTIAGRENPAYGVEMRRYITDHGLSEYVSMLGELNGVKDLLAKMDVGLMLSDNEAFGRVTVEYMHANLAVIASKSGANTEIIGGVKKEDFSLTQAISMPWPAA